MIVDIPDLEPFYKTALVFPLDLRWAKSPIANRWRSANAVNSRRPFCRSTWNKYYTNEHQSRDSNRSATNAGLRRPNPVFLGGDMTANERL